MSLKGTVVIGIEYTKGHPPLIWREEIQEIILVRSLSAFRNPSLRLLTKLMFIQQYSFHVYALVPPQVSVVSLIPAICGTI